MLSSYTESDIDFSVYLDQPSSPQDEHYTEIVINDKKLYQCLLPDCGKTFKFKSEMNRHQATHSNLRPYVCFYDNCKKGFKRPDALKNHMRTHTNVARYICTEEGCGSQFVNRAALKYHNLKHKDNKVYKCSHPGCNKAFVSLTQLRQHEKAVKYHRWIKKTESDDVKIELMQTPEDSTDGNGSLTETSVTTDNGSPEPINKYEFIENSLKNFKVEQELLEDAPDMYEYLESIYGKKKVHVEGSYLNQANDFYFAKNLNVNELAQISHLMRSIGMENREYEQTFQQVPTFEFDYDLDQFLESRGFPVDQTSVDKFFNL